MHPSIVEVVVSVRVEVERLSHKDIRQRRRAIRHLFELNDPFALSGFLPFLDSDEMWFVDQSIEAVRRWDNGENIELLQRLSKHPSKKIRLVSIEICGRYKESGSVLSILRSDSDSEVSKRAWVHSLRQFSDSEFEEIVDEGLSSVFVNIRRATIESAIRRETEKYVLRGLDDSAPVVVSKSIEGLRIESIGIERIRSFLVHPSSMVCSVAHNRLHDENALDIQDTMKLLSNPTGEAIDAVIHAYSGRMDWAEKEILDFLLAVPSDSLIPRLVRRSPLSDIDSVRAKLLLGSCNDIRKMRYLEDLVGRNFGPDTLSAVKTISEARDEGPVRAMAIEVLEDRNSLGRTEVEE